MDNENNYQEMNPAEIEKSVESIYNEFKELKPEDFSNEQIDQMVEAVHNALYLGNIDLSANVLELMKPVVYHRIDSTEIASEEALSYMAEWNLLALRFTPMSSEEFAELPYFMEIIYQYEKAEPKFRIMYIQTKLSLILHYLDWINNGGTLNNFSDENRKFLENLEANCENELLKDLDAMREKAELRNAIELSQAMFKFYRAQDKPNEELKMLKFLLVDIEKDEESTKADLADVNMEVAKLLANYEKFDIAQPYFQDAKSLYESLGEEYEMLMYQAEAWVEECAKHIGE